MQPKRSAARKRKLQLLLPAFALAVGKAPAFAGRRREQKLELSLTAEDLFDFNKRSDRAGLEDLLGFFF